MSIFNFSVKLSHFNINVSIDKVKHRMENREKAYRREERLEHARIHREMLQAQFHNMNLFN
ncbi:hypothetical protein [Alkaliphilus crotonatoxidans]